MACDRPPDGPAHPARSVLAHAAAAKACSRGSRPAHGAPRAGRDLAALRQGRRRGRDRALGARLRQQWRQRERIGQRRPQAGHGANRGEQVRRGRPITPRACCRRTEAAPRAGAAGRGARPDRGPARCRARALPPLTGTCSEIPFSIAFTCAGMSSGPSVSCTQRAFAGARRSSAVTRSVCTSGSAFSWITSEAEVWRI